MINYFFEKYYLIGDKIMAINGFRSAGITEATENAKDTVVKVEHPFKEV